MDNELGPQSAGEISKMLLWPNPHCIDKLVLSNLRVTSYAMAMILSSQKGNRKLSIFEIEKIPLNNAKNFEYLCSFLKANKSIKVLKLSWVNFLPMQIIEVMNIVKRRKTIHFLDLSYNNMAPEPRHKSLIRTFINVMRRFILRT